MILQLLVVFAGLVAVYAIILGGGRDRAHRKTSDRLDKLGVPTGGLSVAMLGSVAMAQLWPVDDMTSVATVGACTGFLIGSFLAVASGGTALILDVFGGVAALVLALRFITDPSEGHLGVQYRLAMMGLLLTCFYLGLRLTGRARFFNRGRGLTLLGLVDIVTFMAGPAGVSLLDLDEGRHAWYLVVVAIAALTLGLTASQITVYLMAAGVAVVSLGLSYTLGDSSQFTFVASALVVFFLINKVLRGLIRR